MLKFGKGYQLKIVYNSGL